MARKEGKEPTGPNARVRATQSESMASEPSEADVRMRSYWRFLKRGGTHGMDFDDWLEAEEELKRNTTHGARHSPIR
jgi:Protein of unknown function (DUF2934)